jgi:hypothetical protein
MTAPATKLHSDILEFLGRTDDKVCQVVERAILDADLATLILFTTMKYHLTNKAK